MKASLFLARDYRGATVEDLDIRPAISINPSTPIKRAVQVAFEHEFTFLPVIHETKKRLLGVLNVQEQDVAKILAAKQEPLTKDAMLWFSQEAKAKYTALKSTTPLNTKIIRPRPLQGKPYEVLTPATPLETLSAFFNNGNYFAIITSDAGDLVYGVVTPEDLLKYENSRPRL